MKDLALRVGNLTEKGFAHLEITTEILEMKLHLKLKPFPSIKELALLFCLLKMVSEGASLRKTDPD